MFDLAIRKTRHYVGSYKHLDTWATIGTGEEIGSVEIPQTEEEESDPQNPVSTRHYVLVCTEFTPEETEQALRDTYTEAGCACEHDCCGCVSTYVNEVKNETGRLWFVDTTSTKNY